MLLASMVVVIGCFLWVNDSGSRHEPLQQQQQHHAKEHYQVYAAPQQQAIAEEEDLPSFHFSEPVAFTALQGFSSHTLFTAIPLYRVNTTAIPIYVRNHSWKHFLI
jgi:hypothetical protein